MGSCSHEHHNALHGVHDHPNVAQRLAEAESLCAASGARLTFTQRGTGTDSECKWPDGCV